MDISTLVALIVDDFDEAFDENVSIYLLVRLVKAEVGSAKKVDPSVRNMNQHRLSFAVVARCSCTIALIGIADGTVFATRYKTY